MGIEGFRTAVAATAASPVFVLSVLFAVALLSEPWDIGPFEIDDVIVVAKIMMRRKNFKGLRKFT